jgi:7-cyano-7-deazaguanine synthase
MRDFGLAVRDLTSAVLLSAGLDSAVLAATEERTAIERLLQTQVYRGCARLERLAFTVRDLYPATHWALRGVPPAFDTPDEDVYLTGRNIVLLSKAGIYCAQHGIPRLAIGPLAGNPFPDATPEFFAAMARALSLGLDHDLDVVAPFSEMEKSAVIRLGVELGVPLELTLSCMNPRQGKHCGRCSKCRERRDAFLQAGVVDPTDYSNPPVR